VRDAVELRRGSYTKRGALHDMDIKALQNGKRRSQEKK